jgi:hypothetical protein
MDAALSEKITAFMRQTADGHIPSAAIPIATKASAMKKAELEELKLVASEKPYFWRIKAVDGASNESDWTGASMFYAPTPFKLPSWGIYVGAVVGALLFFLIVTRQAHSLLLLEKYNQPLTTLPALPPGRFFITP